MKFTNRHGAPKTLLNLLQRDTYSRGASRISVTQLIGPPRIDLLRQRHADEIELDVADALWMLIGRALHVVAEQGADEEHIPEERLFADVLGWRVSGAMDLQKLGEHTTRVTDYKFTGSWSLMHDKPEWEAQLNCYAWLLQKCKGWTVEGLEVCAFVRDWSRHQTNREGYPQAPIQVVPIRQWSYQEQESYIEGRVRLHQDAARAMEWSDEPPLCTPEERWERPTSYAVMRKGQKRAAKVFGSEEQAVAYAASAPNALQVEMRPGEAIRCQHYCPVGAWCQQWQQDPRRTT